MLIGWEHKKNRCLSGRKNLVYEREWVGSWTRSMFLTCTRFVGRVDENWVFLVVDLHKICSSFVREVCLLHEIRSSLGRENWVSCSWFAGSVRYVDENWGSYSSNGTRFVRYADENRGPELLALTRRCARHSSGMWTKTGPLTRDLHEIRSLHGRGAGNVRWEWEEEELAGERRRRRRDQWRMKGMAAAMALQRPQRWPSSSMLCIIWWLWPPEGT